MADHAGILTCSGGNVPTLPSGDPDVEGDYESISKDGVAGEVDLADCLVPNYIVALPFDPIDTNGYWTDNDNYNTGYTIVQNSVTQRLTVRAPMTELDLDEDGTPNEFEEEISITR